MYKLSKNVLFITIPTILRHRAAKQKSREIFVNFLTLMVKGWRGWICFFYKLYTVNCLILYFEYQFRRYKRSNSDTLAWNQYYTYRFKVEWGRHKVLSDSFTMGASCQVSGFFDDKNVSFLSGGNIIFTVAEDIVLWKLSKINKL